MKRTVRVLASVATAGALAAGGVAASSSPAHAAYAGGVDVAGWCASQLGGGLYIRTWNAWGWRCYAQDQFWPYSWWAKGVDMNAACHLTYGWDSWASVQDFNNPYSWYCNVPS